MGETALKTAVVFILFNRPQCAQRVMEQIRAARPQRLYLVADGPRPQKPGEQEACAAARQAAEALIDWPCEVKRNYSETNLGCRKRIVSGLDWVFGQEEEAIILEDDIVPDRTFFAFCSAMLDAYRGNERVMQIAGFKEIDRRPRDGADCLFSTYTSIWGWATWRRAWNRYQPTRTDWKNDKELLLHRCRGFRHEAAALIHRIEAVEAGRLDTWDFHWSAALRTNEGLSVVPARNLVKNVGFGAEATHTRSPFNPCRFKRQDTLPPPYRLPVKVEQDRAYDRLVGLRRSIACHMERVKDRLLCLAP